MDALLTVKQAAAALALSEREIYALCENRQLEHQRIGCKRRSIRIEPTEIAAYKKRSTVSAKASKQRVSRRPTIGIHRGLMSYLSDRAKDAC